MDKFLWLAMIVAVGYFVVLVVRFVVEMIRAPEGTLTEAFLSNESPEETRWSTPRERERYWEIRR
jgi:hypothetical protein